MNAKEFAYEKHKNQLYGRGESAVPYTRHLDDVYNVLTRFQYFDYAILTAAWLHDVLEDTDCSYNDLKERFGSEVADIVYCVTDELGKNRKERKSKTYPKIMSNDKSLIIKLADRIANIEYGIKTKSNLIDMYKKEQFDFKDSLYKPNVADNLWNHLFNILEV